MAKAARLIEGGSRPVARARFAPLKLMADAYPWHTTKWAALPSRLLWGGDRRMEAENYLSSGYGIRLAIEARAQGWEALGGCAQIWQPSRLKGIQVHPSFGTPFLAATQVFDVRPVSRKWLSLERTPDNAQRFIKEGTIMLTCSGAVGRATLAFKPHSKLLISHDLLRISALEAGDHGWIYAYLRSPMIRQIMTGAHYGHVIKHLEISHIAALPVPTVGDAWRSHFNADLADILRMRNEAHACTLEAERVFEEAVTPLKSTDDGESGFSVRASRALFATRRRLDGLPHNPHCSAVVRHLTKHADSMISIRDAGFNVWVPGRYKRIPAEDGIGYLDSSDLFEINPDIEKRFADCGFGDRFGGRVQPGWLLIACSGQIYGVNGSCTVSGVWLDGKAVSNHVMRVAPTSSSVCRIGYLATALGHPTLGRPRVKALAFGSSIPEIEVEDFQALQIPRLPKSTEDRIADVSEKAAALRSQADILENRMAAEADGLIEAFIAGKDLETIPPPA